MSRFSNAPTLLELCAGAGGQAIGLEQAGFSHLALIENDLHACNTLRFNRPDWTVIEHDLFEPLDLAKFNGVDLLAGGLPCPPFSVAGKQLGEKDERNLFNVGLNYVEAIRPKAVMFENVKGMLEKSFSTYREWIDARLTKMGYVSRWKLINACDHGVAQLRPRVVLVALQRAYAGGFVWPEKAVSTANVGETLVDLMAAGGWPQAQTWADKADTIAPTLVGGSKKHGGPDLGPVRSRKAWAELGVNGAGVANEAPSADFVGMPKLTVEMTARLQGFPSDWRLTGGKTAQYRQVGNAFPPPVAEAVGRQIMLALGAEKGQLADGIAAQ